MTVPGKRRCSSICQAFLAFCFPDIHADIDWTRPHEFLDKEFQQVVRDATTGRRLVDLLVRVWLVSGEDLWVLVHVEVQNDEDAELCRTSLHVQLSHL